MRLISAEVDGWMALKERVAERDKVCLATRSDVFGKDIATDLCRNGMGWVIREDNWRDMEFEHVKEELGMSLKAKDDEAHGVLCCGWHHRLSTQWRIDTAAHREKVREYLARHYPEVWAEFLALQALPSTAP